MAMKARFCCDSRVALPKSHRTRAVTSQNHWLLADCNVVVCRLVVDMSGVGIGEMVARGTP